MMVLISRTLSESRGPVRGLRRLWCPLTGQPTTRLEVSASGHK
jgi:hypothetical protein